jgi:hypothetical protein
MVCGGQILFQGAVVFVLKRERCIHYLGNVMTVSLLGAVSLSPMFFLSPFIQSDWAFIGYFGIVVTFMFFEHWRRVKILGLPLIVSVTWVLYRFIVLAIIL